MTRYGGQYGPDITFLGVDKCDLDEPASYALADVVIVGAPFDGFLDSHAVQLGTAVRAGQPLFAIS